MGRLKDKNILLVVPSDYYDEEQFEPLMETFNAEEANVVVASAKLKDAIGMRKGKLTPQVMIVDSVEGIVGDSYVTATGTGSRQVKGVYHGVVLVGGKGARKYMWNDRVLHVLLSDRHRSGFILGAVGTAVPTLGVAGLLEGKNATAELDKHSRKALDEANALLEDEDVVVDKSVITDRGAAAVITANGAGAIEKFAQTVIDYVQNTEKK